MPEYFNTRFPITPNHWVSLTLPAVMTPREWQRFLAVLESMRDGLVAEPEPGGFQHQKEES